PPPRLRRIPSAAASDTGECANASKSCAGPCRWGRGRPAASRSGRHCPRTEAVRPADREPIRGGRVDDILAVLIRAHLAKDRLDGTIADTDTSTAGAGRPRPPPRYRHHHRRGLTFVRSWRYSRPLRLNWLR